MENYYNKTKSLAIAALIIAFIIFIWDAATLIRSLLTILEHLDNISRFYSLRNFISGILRLLFVYGSIAILNIMILTKQKNKTSILVALALVLVLIGLQLTGGLSNLFDGIFFIKDILFVLKSLILLILKIILFIITLYQFIPFIKLIKEETAA